MKRTKYPKDPLDEIQRLVIRIYRYQKLGQIETVKLLDTKLAGLQRTAAKTRSYDY